MVCVLFIKVDIKIDDFIILYISLYLLRNMKFSNKFFIYIIWVNILGSML